MGLANMSRSTWVLGLGILVALVAGRHAVERRPGGSGGSHQHGGGAMSVPCLSARRGHEPKGRARDTGAHLVIPQGSLTSPLDVTYAARKLSGEEGHVPEGEALAGAALVPDVVDLGPPGTTFAGPVVLEMPIAWPGDYDAMTSGWRLVPVAAYSQGKAGGAWVRENLADSGGTGDGATAWLLLDATRQPRLATALVGSTDTHTMSFTLMMGRSADVKTRSLA